MRSLLFVLSGLMLVSCQPQAPTRVPGELDRTGAELGKVNGLAVSQGMLDKMISTIPPQVKEQLEKSGRMDQLKDQLITQDALYQEALKQKMHEQENVKTMLVFAERETMIEALLRKVVDERTSDDAMQKWYDEHSVQFRRPQVQAAHILVATEAEAKDIKAQLDGGADFGALAAAKSTDAQTAASGGVVGWITARDLPPQLSAPILAADKGAVLDPIASPDGASWHVFKVLDKRDLLPLDEVKDQVRSRMQSEVVEAYVEEIKTAATGGATVTAPEGGAPAPAVPVAPPAPAGAGK